MKELVQGRHTPGPWEAVGSRVRQYEIRDGEKLWGLFVADCSMLDEGEANAQLIAANLDMFSALAAAREYLVGQSSIITARDPFSVADSEELEPIEALIMQIDAVITKATAGPLP